MNACPALIGSGTSHLASSIKENVVINSIIAISDKNHVIPHVSVTGFPIDCVKY